MQGTRLLTLVNSHKLVIKLVLKLIIVIVTKLKADHNGNKYFYMKTFQKWKILKNKKVVCQNLQRVTFHPFVIFIKIVCRLSGDKFVKF